ncbi:hypothetical protein [Paenibacillus sp. MMS20-IR301]|uniref:hypothetical protein n=1 Tax=Paenibacillus sp. MMS20-IR301 TaxID=2895946 RepID=UPI0028E730A9|nr:hypothetical protein [Paenibacillus sp. MMS20-IR301]WNS45533.1 hypothetical protein LOS79_09770 [Paenibacillus sp. MMS20-IR301]
MDNDLAKLLRSVIREELVPVNDRLERIEAEQTAQRQDVHELKQDVHELKQDVQELKQDVHELKQDVQELKQDVQVLQQDQGLIKRAVLETNERLINVESLLENQHRIIELLSVRSIEHEAQIKRIK